MNPSFVLLVAQQSLVLPPLAFAPRSQLAAIDLRAKLLNALRVSMPWTLLSSVLWTAFVFLLGLFRCRVAPVCGGAPMCWVH
jgi:hypothetical protein